jgi:hypothetical protein
VDIETKKGILVGVAVVLIILIGVFKLKAAVPLTLAAGVFTYKAWEMAGSPDTTTAIFAGLTAFSALAVFVLVKGKSRAGKKKAKAAAGAH